MALTQYKRKRLFDQTPEPEGGKASGAQLRFVIQKHAASHLHYDFRLEMGGALKSWAVPKGPSMDPAVKRLAMMVEDHPYDYRNFEGVIPEGNYGAGTVMVWDEGTYEPFGSAGKSKEARDKELRHQLHQGKLKFILHGSKLKGTFALVKSTQRGDNGWLLMKVKDEYAVKSDILLQDRSVLSDRTLEEISKPVKQSSKAPAKKTRAVKKSKTPGRTAAARTKKKDISDERSVGRRTPFPVSMKPMLATLVDKVVDGDGWLYEVKWDGYRALGFVNGEESSLRSRNEKSFDDKFYPVYQAISAWPVHAVVDGEIVVVNESGISDFGALQNWRSEADGSLIYYVFDILWLDGRDLTGVSLTERRKILAGIMPEQSDIIRLSDVFETNGKDFFDSAKAIGLEGIIAKKKDSFYHPDARTMDWVKIKANKRQEVVIGGFTRNDDSSKIFSALLVGVYDGKQLVYTGKIGTGFTDKMQRGMMEQFKPLITTKRPFTSDPDINKPSRFRPDPPHATATWLKPKLVCEVSFTEITSDGVMRHPSFEGMREDKKASSVTREIPRPITSADVEKSSFGSRTIAAPKPKQRKTLLNPTEETQVREMDGHTIKFTNLSKVYWPDVKVTKRDMLNYYYQVAPYILTYLKGRPQSLNRFPNGINGKSFYQKDVTGKVPGWVKTYLYHSSDEERDKHFMIPTDEASVLYMASLGCIEMNPWSSTIDSPDHPDWCIIDLDPDKNTFDQVIEAAQVTRKVLDELHVPSFPKTSGSTGLHIYIPLARAYTYEQSKEFARFIVTLVHERIPKYTSIERKVSDRGGKMYLDFLQNRPKATLAAPYSLRPKPGAPVSMPLDWSEVRKGLSITDFTIFNAMERIRVNGDIFKDVLGKGVDLEKIIERFGSQ